MISHRRDRENLLWEDHRVAAFLHEDWAVPGHSVVVWKRHVENLSDLAEYDAAHLMSFFSATERAILHATGRSRSIVLKLGLLVPHLHMHIYPFSDSASRADVFAAINNESHHVPSARAALVDSIRHGIPGAGESR